MKTMLFTGILGITLFIGSFFNPGQPVPGAEVYLVQEGSDQPVAFVTTSDKGKASFANLSGGMYYIKVNFPRQSGKMMRGRNNPGTKLEVGYHNDKKIYFVKEDEGFFTIKYSGIKQFVNKNITPIYNLTLEGRSKQVEIGKFEVSRNNGAFTMEIRAQKPKKFGKTVEKVIGDLGMVTIRNAR
ncbi:MAG: carboxypeptidase-like regulatory domain-containing protein [Mariniphaga sp.]|jgi:hypothetical protein|nr:carboxypeptidase-like regulatory domain-containing protein [Mariniphaga sp.]